MNFVKLCSVNIHINRVYGEVHFKGSLLTYWDRVTHVCVSKLTTIGSRRQVIIWANARVWLIRTLEIGFSEILPWADFIHSRKCIWRCRLRNGGNVSVPMFSDVASMMNYILIGYGHVTPWAIITLRPRQNGRHFANDIFKSIFINENAWFPIKISLKLVPWGLINNIPALVRIMAWRRPGDKPLSEPMMVRLSTHICVARPHWVIHHKTPTMM